VRPAKVPVTLVNVTYMVCGTAVYLAARVRDTYGVRRGGPREPYMLPIGGTYGI